MVVKFYFRMFLSKLFKAFIKFEKVSPDTNVEFSLMNEEAASRIFEHNFEQSPKWLELKTKEHRISSCRILHNASIINDGIILNPKNEVVFDSILSSRRYLDIQYSNHYIVLRKFLKFQIVDYCIALNNPLANNYFHWLFESIGSIVDYDFDKTKGLKFIVSSNAANFIQDSLSFLLNISPSDIIIKENLNIKAKKLILPSLSFYRLYPLEDYSSIYNPQVFTNLNKLVKDKISKNKKSKNILISRVKAGQRRIINEQDIVTGLASLGIDLELVTCEGLTLKQQVELFASSKIIISAHGAGLSNIVFAQEKAIVIEFFPSSRLVRDAFFYYQITKALNFHHLIVKVKSINTFEDMQINNHVIGLIHKFIIKAQEQSS